MNNASTVDPVLLRHAGDHTPRYTSYPTAPHFHAGVDGETYRRWLSELTPGRRGSLYLHIPFCRMMCWYCGCHTRASLRDGPVERYVDALECEIDAVALALPFRLPVEHVHWGGGSPTLVPPARLTAMMKRLRERFAIAPDAEIAIEIDPRTLDAAKAGMLGACGFNRASLGVQTFDPAVQRAINRIQDFETTLACANRLRAAGVAALNVDLIYGLPKQTKESCRETVEQVLALQPARLSVFGYAHVPHMKPHMRMIDDADLPGAEARIAQAAAIGAALRAAGYVAIGLDHYARPDDALAAAARAGRLRRNFQGYTTDPADALIGFGASAIGRLPQGHVQNTASTPAWERAAMQGELAVARGYALDAEDRLRADVIERLMCDLEVDLDQVGAAHGRAAPDADLSGFIADGVVRRDGARIRISPRYHALARNVAAAFDARLHGSSARHSVSV